MKNLAGLIVALLFCVVGSIANAEHPIGGFSFTSGGYVSGPPPIFSPSTAVNFHHRSGSFSENRWEGYTYKQESISVRVCGPCGPYWSTSTVNVPKWTVHENRQAQEIYYGFRNGAYQSTSYSGFKNEGHQQTTIDR